MPSSFSSRLTALRAELDQAHVDGFLVPMADEFQSEYVPASAQRLLFLSGFSGSAGFIIILKDKAGFFTDGRYTLQAQQQVPPDLFTLNDISTISPLTWLSEHVTEGAKIGYDPWLHTNESILRFEKELSKVKAELIPLDKNPVDAVWHDRPPAPQEPVLPYSLAYSGKNSSDKRSEIASDLKHQKISFAVLTDPASIAWLLNVRGGDVPHTPLPLSFAILADTGKVRWFVDPAKVTHGLQEHVGTDVSIEHPGQFPDALDRLACKGETVRVDGGEISRWIVDRLQKTSAVLNFGDDPCVLPKACKNAVELEGMRAAHRRDGAALVSFLAWLHDNFATGDVTEISAEEKLASLRAQQNLYRGPSFDTISGIGAHGAIVHYRATLASNRKLELGQLYLLDSGGQYLDGTTDVTRTVMLGKANHEIRDRFTRVLKGHIALASVAFPEGTSGAELDVLARQFLWAVGLDFNHGTGHGVGNYLGVHEGPQGISKRNRVPLKVGMVVSNEPGYYKAGQYGIRIENLQAVVNSVKISNERKMLCFEPLTLVPIDRGMIEVPLLTNDERLWLNRYHARVREVIYPMVDSTTAQWLTLATDPL